MHKSNSPEGCLVVVLVRTQTNSQRPEIIELLTHTHGERDWLVVELNWQTEKPEPNPNDVQKGEDDVA